MRNAPVLVSIVIVNYNGWTLLRQCLDSIYRELSNIAYEVWVVDNGSTDGSVALIQEQYPEVMCISNDVNRGFAAANNQAITVANGEYILLLNNDTVVYPGSIESLLEALKNDETLAGAGPKLIRGDGRIQPSCMRFPTISRTIANFVGTKFGGDPRYVVESVKSVVYVDAVTGACMLIRRSAVDDVGALDEGYFMYAEETDWCYRASKKGWKIGYVPAAHVTHFGGQTSGREPERFYVERRYSNVRFFLKHYGPLSARLGAFLLRSNMRLRWLISRRNRAQFQRIMRDFDARVEQLFLDAAKWSTSNKL